MSARDHEVRESTLTQYNPGGSEDLRGEFQGKSDRSQAAKQKMTPKPATTSGRLKETSFVVIMLNPLKYIDVTRDTQTNLDVLQEKRINDSGKVDGDRTLSDSWTGFTKFTLFSEKPPGYMRSRD